MTNKNIDIQHVVKIKCVSSSGMKAKGFPNILEATMEYSPDFKGWEWKIFTDKSCLCKHIAEDIRDALDYIAFDTEKLFKYSNFLIIKDGILTMKDGHKLLIVIQAEEVDQHLFEKNFFKLFGLEGVEVIKELKG